MYPVSQTFLAAVRQSHTVARRLDVCNVDGSVRDSITPSGGEVTVDAKRPGRRECSYDVPDYTGSLTPAAATDLLSNVAGYELRPYRGVAYSDGTTELVPLGVFPLRVSETSLGSDGVPVVRIGGQDRSSTVSRNRWTSVFKVASGTTLEDAIAAILADRAPQFPTNLPATGWTLPKDYAYGTDIENDPWADAVNLAADGGWDLFFDVTGTVTMQAPTDPTKASPVITYANDSTAVTIEAAKQWDSEKAYNGVIFIGESSGTAPVRAEAWDDDPASPTYYLGAYGKYPKIVVSTKVSNADQALAAAQAELARIRGVAQTVNWTQLVNPALDANDAVGFTHTDLRITSQLVVVLDSLTIPWGVDAGMNATTRSRQVAA